MGRERPEARPSRAHEAAHEAFVIANLPKSGSKVLPSVLHQLQSRIKNSGSLQGRRSGAFLALLLGLRPARCLNSSVLEVTSTCDVCLLSTPASQPDKCAVNGGDGRRISTGCLRLIMRTVLPCVRGSGQLCVPILLRAQRRCCHHSQQQPGAYRHDKASTQRPTSPLVSPCFGADARTQSARQRPTAPQASASQAVEPEAAADDPKFWVSTDS